jgi:predicted metalloprotease with PDZ domain
MPKGSLGICSLGEGNCEIKSSSSILLESFYMAGKALKSEENNFGFYWLENPGFYGLKVSQFAKDLYKTMSVFFKDRNNSYRIFARKVEEDKCGGTALKNSYHFVYPPDSPPKPTDIKFLFAHEMVHNWAKMNDEPFGTLTWYVEGMAEYYSALLLWKNNLISKDELISELNKRSRKYYENPHKNIKNEEAGKLLFNDSDATKVPYGRGFFYMAQTDAKILEATNAEKSLDDIMFAIKEKFDSGKNPAADEWLNQIKPYIKTAEQDFKAMQNGAIIEPNLARFGIDIKAIKKEGFVRGTDKACKLWLFE